MTNLTELKISDCDNNIEIIYLNIRSYAKNFDLFESYLHSQNFPYFFDIILCWLSQKVHINEFHCYEKDYINSNRNKTSGNVNLF